MSISTSKPLPKRLVGVSMKMYFDLHPTEAYIQSLRQTYQTLSPSCGLFIIPSNLAVRDAIVALNEIPQISLGAQNCHWQDRGAYTGETSSVVLGQISSTLVELGHAKRRRPPINEDDMLVAERTQATVRNKLVPLMCIEEKGRRKIASKDVRVAMRECVPKIMTMLNTIPKDAPIIFAYESS